MSDLIRVPSNESFEVWRDKEKTYIKATHISSGEVVEMHRTVEPFWRLKQKAMKELLRRTQEVKKPGPDKNNQKD